MKNVEHVLDDAGILKITLQRPEKCNALNEEVLLTLATLFARAKENNHVKAILLTGEGKAFCAGADIGQIAECDARLGYQFAQEGQAVFRQLETLGKPSIAAIQGYALGGGCELCMAATLRIAATDAQFGQPEVKLGLLPGYGGTQRLARLVGKGRALDLCLTARTIDAETALQWGLVNAVCASEYLLDLSYQWLQNILSMPPLAIKSIMEVIDHGYDLSLPDALHLEALHFATLCASEDKKRGVHAFLNKEKAVFEGR